MAASGVFDFWSYRCLALLALGAGRDQGTLGMFSPHLCVAPCWTLFGILLGAMVFKG